AGPWIDEAAGTWDATRKVAVQGNVSWPIAQYDEQSEADTRRISSNGLPVGMVTGTFPIAATDPAYAYDRNPNRIAATALTFTLPLVPTAAETPGCLGMGAIGVLRNGVALFAPVDEQLRDAVAYETQDVCDGHPQQASQYHYHAVPSCIVDASTGPSTVVGFALDGVPIVVERDASGALPKNADLDACHGRTSPILLDGEVVTMYHYSATLEFPYALGCLRGTVTS
ncbi:MAG: YHYH protein, partial [Actinomycetota bacterium]